jgi:hypothetical protein
MTAREIRGFKLTAVAVIMLNHQLAKSHLLPLGRNMSQGQCICRIFEYRKTLFETLGKVEVSDIVIGSC